MKKLIISMGLFLFIVCCNQSTKNTISDSIIITVGDESYQKSINYSQLFDSVKYFALDNCDDCLIGQIDKIIFSGNRFYILDIKQNILFAFSDTGELIWKIDKRGNGPGEYTRLEDFDLHNNKIYLFDPRRKVLEYDLFGNYVKHFSINNIFGTMMLVDNETFYFYTCNNSSTEGDYHLLIMDKYGQKFKNGIPIMQKNLISQCVTFNQSNAFFRYHDKIRFFMPFSTNIFSIEGDSISIPYYFDFKSKNIPVDFLNNNTYEDLKNTSYAYGLNSFWENDSYLSFNIRFNDNEWFLLYTKNENKLTYYGSFLDDISYCFPIIQTVNNDYAIGYRSMDALFREYNYAKNASIERKNTVLEKIITNSDEEDNPVIFICFFKK